MLFYFYYIFVPSTMTPVPAPPVLCLVSILCPDANAILSRIDKFGNGRLTGYEDAVFYDMILMKVRHKTGNK
jgi:hypothetical protein